MYLTRAHLTPLNKHFAAYSPALWFPGGSTQVGRGSWIFDPLGVLGQLHSL